MLIEDVTKLNPVDRYLYWCGERHNVYLARQAGRPKPWSDDTILQQNYFTNVYRELDRTTATFRQTVRDPLKSNIAVVFATIAWRWFNFSPTGEALREGGWLRQWDESAVLAHLGVRRDLGEQVFTGAFMINSPPGERKLEAICRRISRVWADRESLERRAARWRSLQAGHADLIRYDGLGGFMAYEVVCDLRYTDVLGDAPDVATWSNPGPGAIRGLLRVLGRPIPNKSNATSPPVPKDWTEKTQWLLSVLRGRYPAMPRFEMREVEMSLCEYDKYDRLLFAEGRSKRKYDGAGGATVPSDQPSLWALL